MMGVGQTSTPPEAYILYKQLEAWDWHHLPARGGFDEQAYLVMMQIRVVRSAIARYDESKHAAQTSIRQALPGMMRP